MDGDTAPASPEDRRNLFVYNGGFLTRPRIRRILHLAGWDIRLGAPGAADWVGCWGQSPTAPRGEAVAARMGAPLLRVEDAFLRSVRMGRDGEPPLGLLLDNLGVHFDPAEPSRLEEILSGPLDDSALMARARSAMAWMQDAQLSKYNGFDPEAAVPEAPYVLVIDQTRGDASVTASGAGLDTFRDMLVAAQVEQPGLPVYIKTHPETDAGHREGHFSADDETDRVRLVTGDVSPWRLMEGAVAVYTVSSGMGFEAILAGHRPRVFGAPFYAGWGLTEDEAHLSRRRARLTRAQLFAGAMILYPTWYDPYLDRLCSLEEVMATLEARARAAREDAPGYVAAGMRLWKRKPLAHFFAGTRPMVFSEGARAARRAEADGRRLMAWAGAADSLPAPALRIEDGFLRSRGLGAELVPPLSLVRDDLGIYYDPTRESRLERLIAAAPDLPEHARARAAALATRLTEGGLTKYNLDGDLPEDLPARFLLVPGQVEDDASVRLGCGAVATNLDLLRAARETFPAAKLVYKPHPDVEAGLRPGAVPEAEALALADAVAPRAEAAALLERCAGVVTMTSLMGFEALLRGKPVTTFGAPFYAGWGLTRDIGTVPERRRARPDVTALVHAVLIDYPRYFDPLTGTPCPVEVVVDRLEMKELPRGAGNRTLSKLQGLLASLAPIWRR